MNFTRFDIALRGAASINSPVLIGLMPNFDEFDPDEGFLLIGSGIISLFGLGNWLFKLQRVSKWGAHPLYRMPLYAAVLLGFLLLSVVIARWADPQIRANSGYVLLVLLMGGAVLTLVAKFLPWLGLSVRDDVFEQRNFAAVLVLSGLTLGVMITYGAANVGTGPSFWNNVFSSLLATGTLVFIWFVMATGGRVAVSIVEERDVATGLRLGCLLVAESLILGRATAGDWTSAAATTQHFFRDGWPALLLCMMAVPLEGLLRPTLRNPQRSVGIYGFIVGLVYLLAALAWCAHPGGWEGSSK